MQEASEASLPKFWVIFLFLFSVVCISHSPEREEGLQNQMLRALAAAGCVLPDRCDGSPRGRVNKVLVWMPLGRDRVPAHARGQTCIGHRGLRP